MNLFIVIELMNSHHKSSRISPKCTARSTRVILALAVLVFIGYCAANQFKLFVLTSGSMEPALSAGTLVITQPRQRYYPGEVVTFNREMTVGRKKRSLVVTHRVLSSSKTDDGFVYQTKGDSNQSPDEEILNHNSIYGKALMAVPLIGFLLMWPYSSIGFYFLIILPALLILCSQVFTIINQFAKDS